MEKQNDIAGSGCALAMPFLKPIVVTGSKKSVAAELPARRSLTSTVPNAAGGPDADPEMPPLELEGPDDGDDEFGQGEPVSPTSMMFHDTRFHNTILAVMGSSKRVDVAYAKAALEATLVRHPRFSSIQVWDGGKARWVRTNLNVDNHVIVPELNPSTIPSPDLFVEEYLSSLSTTMLDFSKPLWELHLLDIPTSEAEATLVFRIHHSIGDGISLISLLIACCRRSNLDPDGPLITLPQKGRTATTVKGTTVKAWGWTSFVMRFLGVLAVVWNSVVAALLLAFTRVGWLKDTETPMNARKEASKLNRTRYVNMTVSLQELRAIKQAAGATVNDVLLGALSAGISRYLTRIYGSFGRILPPNIRLRTAVMVNLRKTIRVQAFPDMMAGSKVTSQWGNRIGFHLIQLPIVKFDRALDYVKSAKVIADRKKSSKEARFTNILGILLTKIFGIEVTSSMTCQVMSNITVLLSNIPGPTEEITLWGHHISNPYITVYGFPHALSIHCLSYMDNMKIVLAVDEDVILDPHQLRKDILESFNNLKNDAMRDIQSK